jgi:hypothetical protein
MYAIQPRGVNDFHTPFDDEEVTWTGTASAGLDADKVAQCRIVIIRFISGDGRIRLSGSAASSTEGIPVFAGDIEQMSKFEAQRISGIRGGATNLVAWATYYK